ncbi:hypothetical protein SKAU_G00108450 [Synaphobranchus kaupii]|uniref:Uncharacterized protein n=1 Tax=Synaphobranchus kaupii TaxID=118154 RepID=A0A9Q1J734_SYNKA|nr:hypothetical protein SKAU_G00108450 [Synaphobranchus kaupii]
MTLDLLGGGSQVGGCRFGRVGDHAAHWGFALAAPVPVKAQEGMMSVLLSCQPLWGEKQTSTPLTERPPKRAERT